MCQFTAGDRVQQRGLSRIFLEWADTSYEMLKLINDTIQHLLYAYKRRQILLVGTRAMGINVVELIFTKISFIVHNAFEVVVLQ